MISGERPSGKRVNSWLLRFDDQSLEAEYKSSQQKEMSRYSLRILILILIPTLIISLLILLNEIQSKNQTMIYLCYSLEILCFVLGIIVTKLLPQYFEWASGVIVLCLHGIFCWQMVNKDVSIYNSINQLYLGFIIANIYVLMYFSTHFITKILLILSINFSAIFFFPQSSNVWVMIVCQGFLIIMLSIQAYCQDSLKKDHYYQVKKAKIWDKIITHFLPFNLIVIKLNKLTQRLELWESNQHTKTKLGISTDDELQQFLDQAFIDESQRAPNINHTNFQTPEKGKGLNTIGNKLIDRAYHEIIQKGISQPAGENSGEKQNLLLAPNLQDHDYLFHPLNAAVAATTSNIKQTYQDKLQTPSLPPLTSRSHSYKLNTNKNSIKKQISLNFIPKMCNIAKFTSKNIHQQISPNLLKLALGSGYGGGEQIQSQNFNSQISPKIVGDKFNLKSLLKEKLLKQVEDQEKFNHSDGKLIKESNFQSSEDQETYKINWEKQRRSQSKLSVKIFTYCLIEHFAVLTIEDESSKSLIQRKENNSKFKEHFWKDITSRIEITSAQIIFQLSSQLKALSGVQYSPIIAKLTEILQIGYSLLVLTRNANDYIHDSSGLKNQLIKSARQNSISSIIAQSQIGGNQSQQIEQVNNLQSNQNIQLSMSNSQMLIHQGLNNISDSMGEKSLINKEDQSKQSALRICCNLPSKKVQTIYEICEIEPEREIKALLSIMEQRISHKNISVKLEIESEITTINTNKDRFNRIIYNLLDNAIKFSPDDGKLTIQFKYSTNLSKCIDIEISNTLDYESDIFKISKELDQTLTSEKDNIINPSNKNLQLKLGIPIARKLIGLIGPNDELKYSIQSYSIIFSFSIFIDLNILKPLDSCVIKNNKSFHSLHQDGPSILGQQYKHYGTSYTVKRNASTQRDVRSPTIANSEKQDYASLDFLYENNKIATTPLKDLIQKSYSQKFLFDEGDIKEMDQQNQFSKKDEQINLSSKSSNILHASQVMQMHQGETKQDFNSFINRVSKTQSDIIKDTCKHKDDKYSNILTEAPTSPYDQNTKPTLIESEFEIERLKNLQKRLKCQFRTIQERQTEDVQDSKVGVSLNNNHEINEDQFDIDQYIDSQNKILSHMSHQIIQNNRNKQNQLLMVSHHGRKSAFLDPSLKILQQDNSQMKLHKLDHSSTSIDIYNPMEDEILMHPSKLRDKYIASNDICMCEVLSPSDRGSFQGPQISLSKPLLNCALHTQTSSTLKKDNYNGSLSHQKYTIESPLFDSPSQIRNDFERKTPSAQQSTENKNVNLKELNGIVSFNLDESPQLDSPAFVPVIQSISAVFAKKHMCSQQN